jgi:hypothetical protein
MEVPKPSKKYGTPDEDSPEWTKEKFAHAMRFRELPADLQRILLKPKRGRQEEPTNGVPERALLRPPSNP